uniref:NADH-ubiquinone oxidoreductase chain 5 n=1 Tax=Tomistoma schlegelii TaxID=184245 RepID=Q335Q7_TOMSC|nr:NADH dehydrogenase subunit 5 [Tomistoma schlegelii]QOI74285.1 NADH dehydrogenase subunit 5 [Tomistoma schlegelii]CAH18640.1 NADH dehydrogenase subunit 5 [Tomistoma schlegelii]
MNPAIMLLMLPLTIMLSSLFIPYSKANKSSHAKLLATKLAFFSSLLPLAFFIYDGLVVTSFEAQWLAFDVCPVHVSFTLDTYSVFFLPISLFIAWSIMEFTVKYMKSDPKIDTFFRYLIIFTLMMMILVTAENVYQLFIGWEGVGIMSYMLINWWSYRPASNKAALQAVIYNRLADIGLTVALAWMVVNNLSLDIQGVQASPDLAIIPAFGFILAAAGKSAQFGFHPWLPAAMEGPTPVSALLHSSTMVVAGVFLLIRASSFIHCNKMTTIACLLLGALTSLLAATCALTQNDMKKIIAYSTTSQLGLMMTAIGLKQPELAFMHIATHAFFKAMLFLCAGAIIHNLNNEQDIRKMGGLKKAMPITSACLVIGALSLSGMPFMSGFYSKDAIIEALNTSNINSISLAMTLIATTFTVLYNLRMIYYVVLGTPRLLPLASLPETRQIISPILRLAVGSIAAGLLISTNILPCNIPQLTMPPEVKLAAMIITALALLTGVALILTAPRLPLSNKGTQSPLPFKMANFYFILHHILPAAILWMSQKLSGHLTDQTHYEALGPKMLTVLQILMTKIMTNLHKARINPYLKVIILGITLFLLLYYPSMTEGPPADDPG